MEILVPLFGIIGVFGPIFYVIKRRFDLREQQLKSEAASNLLGDGSEAARELDGLRQENKLLHERIENLEAIVCSVDYELNLRLANLSSQPGLLSQSVTPALPDSGAAAVGLPAAAQPSTSETAATLEPGEPAEPQDEQLAARPTDGLALMATELAQRGSRALPVRDLAVGDIVGKRYRIERLLGRGGMGAVYQAHDQVLGESVALKLISSVWTDDTRAMLERFRREASTARRISSPSVIRIHDLGESEDGLPYISMEYFAGKPLSELMAARGTLDTNEGHDILAQVCDGLHAAHSAGVIHRDLKPQNILVGPRNAVKLIDFGLAKSSFMPELTATGLIMGTPHYMSPEQVRGRTVDARSDIYSLGAVAYHALTGRPPFDGKTPIAIGFAHCSEAPTPPRTVRPSISEALDAMILAALAKRPSDRPQSAVEFRKALDA